MTKIAIRFDYESEYPDVIPSYLGTICPFCGSRQSYITVERNYNLCTECKKGVKVSGYYAEIEEPQDEVDENSRLDDIEENLKKISGSLLEVKLRPQPDMTSVGNKFNRIENAMNETEKRLDDIEERLNKLEYMVRKIEKELMNIRNSMKLHIKYHENQLMK